MNIDDLPLERELTEREKFFEEAHERFKKEAGRIDYMILTVVKAQIIVERFMIALLEAHGQVPIAGEPADVKSIVDAYASWMSENQIPKLFINANPGAILTGPLREYCRSWKNQTEATVPGTHFIQEDSGATIGRLIGVWMQTHILKPKY